jgi:hypothetical protein
LREAENAWRRLRQEQPKGSLITAVDYYLAKAGQLIKDGPALDLVDQFIERRRERGNKDNSGSVARAILRKFIASEGVARISQFTHDEGAEICFR